MTERRAASGRCLCGSVRWESDGSQNWAGYCHCGSCRRNCASPVAAYLGITDRRWRWTGGEPAFYTSSPGVRRYFCRTCGTPMAYGADRFPGETRFYAASLENPEEYAPEFHVHYSEHLPWLAIQDDLPRYPHGGNDGDPE